MRETPLLKAVIKIFKAKHQPLSVPELQEQLKIQDLTPNKTTLYRLLERLQAAGTIESVLLDHGVAHYELKTHHHHHFTCTDCQHVKCLVDPELEAQIHQLENQLEAKGLQVQSHQFSLSGQCAQCA